MHIEVIRSARRQKSVSARLVGDTLVVQAPADLPESELAQIIEKLQTRVVRKRDHALLSDSDLEARAHALNRRHFHGRLRWQSIRWVHNQQKRFGSCTPTQGTIRISQRVAQLPHWVLDYVLMHELAHLLEANHGPRFWDLVHQYPFTERARGYLMALGLEEAEVEHPSDGLMTTDDAASVMHDAGHTR